VAPAHREQFERMLRWYRRFEETSQGRAHSAASDDYVDEIYAFFLNCYHLTDWIINDPALRDRVNWESAVKDWVRNNRSLRLCADICNSLKHLTITRKTWSGESPAFGKKHFGISFSDKVAPASSSVPGALPTIALACEVDTSSGPEDAFQLATGCVAAWKEFWTKHSL
jgi:hypothetical protein